MELLRPLHRYALVGDCGPVERIRFSIRRGNILEGGAAIRDPMSATTIGPISRETHEQLKESKAADETWEMWARRVAREVSDE